MCRCTRWFVSSIQCILLYVICILLTCFEKSPYSDEIPLQNMFSVTLFHLEYWFCMYCINSLHWRHCFVFCTHYVYIISASPKVSYVLVDTIKRFQVMNHQYDLGVCQVLLCQMYFSPKRMGKELIDIFVDHTIAYLFLHWLIYSLFDGIWCILCCSSTDGFQKFQL